MNQLWIKLDHPVTTIKSHILSLEQLMLICLLFFECEYPDVLQSESRGQVSTIVLAEHSRKSLIVHHHLNPEIHQLHLGGRGKIKSFREIKYFSIEELRSKLMRQWSVYGATIWLWMHGRKAVATLFAASSSYSRLSICLTILVWACSISFLSRSCLCCQLPWFWKHKASIRTSSLLVKCQHSLLLKSSW